jgi:uridylate kinase
LVRRHNFFSAREQCHKLNKNVVISLVTVAEIYDKVPNTRELAKRFKAASTVLLDRDAYLVAFWQVL